MKRKANFYSKIINYDIIRNMYLDVKKNVKNKEKIYKFEQYYSSNMIRIYNTLLNKNYIPNRYNIFMIKRPKYRIVMSQSIYDKIINHLVAKYFLVDVLENSLIDTNVATRFNKGTSYGIKKLKEYLNILKQKDIYALKMDISKYFYSIDHDILKQLLKNKIKDNDVINILNNIIDSTNRDYINNEIYKLKVNELKKVKNKQKIKEIESIPYYNKKKGLPIGNMTSQILAIFYLNELDHFIKEKLKAKYYIRYMDDIVILTNEKQAIVSYVEQINFILNKYKLKANNKTQIINVTKNGLDYLGFHFYIINNKVVLKVRNKTRKNFKKKIK